MSLTNKETKIIDKTTNIKQIYFNLNSALVFNLFKKFFLKESIYIVFFYKLFKKLSDQNSIIINKETKINDKTKSRDQNCFYTN